MPVYKGPNQPRSMPYTPKYPTNQLLSLAVSAHLVSKVADPIPFIAGRFDANNLPEKMTFDGHWMKTAFKPKTHYSIVVAAFAKTEVRFQLRGPTWQKSVLDPSFQHHWAYYIIMHAPFPVSVG